MKKEHEEWLDKNSSIISEDFLSSIKASMENIDDDDFDMLMQIKLRNPKKVKLISIFLGCYGVDRFMIGETAIGVIKSLTLGLLGILWIADVFTSEKRTKLYNATKIMYIINPNGYKKGASQKEVAKSLLKKGVGVGKLVNDFLENQDTPTIGG